MHHSLPELGDQDLLVLTDESRRGFDFLRLPYLEAAVRELADDPDDLDTVGQFAVVAVDRARFDLRWLDRVAGLVRAAQPGAELVVAVDQPGEPGHRPDVIAASFDGWRWGGLRTINGRACAVLRDAAVSGGPSDPVAALLATAHTAFWLATTVAARDGTRVLIDDAERLLARQIEDQHRSEQALLAHVEQLADQRRPQPQAAPTLRAVVRGSKAGPPLRAVLHRARRVGAWLRRAGPARGQRAARSGR